MMIGFFYFHLIRAVDRSSSFLDSSVHSHVQSLIPCFDDAVLDEDYLQCARETIQDIISRREAAVARDMSKDEYCRTHAIELEKEIEETNSEHAEKKAHLNNVLYNCPKCNMGHRLDAEDDLKYVHDRLEILKRQVEALYQWCHV